MLLGTWGHWPLAWSMFQYPPVATQKSIAGICVCAAALPPRSLLLEVLSILTAALTEAAPAAEETLAQRLSAPILDPGLWGRATFIPRLPRRLGLRLLDAETGQLVFRQTGGPASAGRRKRN